MAIDRNKNGMISTNEMRVALQKLGLKLDCDTHEQVWPSAPPAHERLQ